ncbi:hypothetical protein BN2476_1240017 [Paraburkholderia piptadeniae]|uniref:Uncharacterized protein n=1 Tax=Paraburkholderia piptadeniae TaxID=1701573 RepID=A0A1N7SVQ4_9BURK|nr:hypothetical protein BN2476_1240017 [Paraburkholderia piptadeniae]
MKSLVRVLSVGHVDLHHHLGGLAAWTSTRTSCVRLPNARRRDGGNGELAIAPGASLRGAAPTAAYCMRLWYAETMPRSLSALPPSTPYQLSSLTTVLALLDQVEKLHRENAQLSALVNIPELHDFAKAVALATSCLKCCGFSRDRHLIETNADARAGARVH